MIWRHVMTLVFASMFVGCDGAGGAIVLDSGNDDAGDDDTGDDDTGDDDSADDDTGDDDAGGDCPWDGVYAGEATLELPWWDEYCNAEAEIIDCEVVGILHCEPDWYYYALEFTGTADQQGLVSGDIEGSITDIGFMETGWSGDVNPNQLTGDFIYDEDMDGWEEVIGEFQMWGH